ncbi:hypothetical protein [uncultured Draconibacterium sp.]|uniref:hypothetical protein n=1 Tax=uncultured Draconibacterium sp. TaxID=1573823 RepID=UPI0025CE76BC|nr:hypothetical protein [uncultured Draconibacterium sp.]
MNDNLTQEQAVKMNLIIAILKNSDQQYPGNTLGADQFYKALKISEERTEHLLRGIISQTYEGAPIVNFHETDFGIKIRMNDFTNDFLRAGGFMQVYEEEQTEMEYISGKQKKEDEALDIQIKQFTLSKNQFILALIVAISGWLAFFINLYLQLKGLI